MHGWAVRGRTVVTRSTRSTELPNTPLGEARRLSADVTLQLLDPDRDIVEVPTPTSSSVVMTVATDDEMPYLDGAVQSVVVLSGSPGPGEVDRTGGISP